MPIFKAAIAEAFAREPLSGNPAGVVILGGAAFLPEETAVRIAAELKYSETAFVRFAGEDEFEIRYYTPVCEAALCGHATVAAFSVLRDKCGLSFGNKLVHTTAGDITVTVERDEVWLDMAEAELHGELGLSVTREAYRALGLPEREEEDGLRPEIASVGLSDIMLPVRDESELAAICQNEAEVAEISRRLNVTGIHAFCISNDGFAAHTRNFAPLCGIPEECATGTSSGGLFLYLERRGLVKSSASFLQGEAMGRPSAISARREKGRVRVGGGAAVLLYGEMMI